MNDTFGEKMMAQYNEATASRIVNIVTHLDEGGAQAVARNISSGLRGRGHDVEVWFLYMKRPNISMRDWEKVILSTLRPGPMGYVRIVRRLVAELSARPPDVVVTHLPLGNVLGQFAARIAGVPHRVAIQHTESWTYKREMRWLDRIAGTLGFYTRNVAVSETVKASFGRYPLRYRRCMRVIPNGVDFHPSDLTPSEARQVFGLPLEVPLVISLGRMSEQKNQAMLIKALSRIESTHLAIAGKGELHEALWALASELGVSDRVHFIGHIPLDRVPDFIRAGDVCGFPSLYEGLSLALLELMRAGIPLVASSIPSNVEVLVPQSGEPAAMLVAPDDEPGWISALREMLADANIRGEYSRRALALSQAYTLDRMMDTYEQLVVGSEPSAVG